MKKYFLFILAFLLLENSAISQSGCPDTQANNYDATAMENDGSCQYPTTNYSLNEITILPTFLEENSGLVFFNDQLWTHNDGGGEDKLYQIDTLTGNLLNTVVVAGADNDDWEDLAEDEEHVYIGDFGNNDGDRMNLRIYKVKKSQFSSGTATAEIIEFSYSDQTDFTTAHHATDFDCEAFFFYNDSLHLFSKNWLDQQTRHYVLPTEAGSYTAELRETFNVQGLITGAAINEKGIVTLLGYDLSGTNLLWVCFDYAGTDFFSGNKRKISLGLALNNSQTEAIVFRENGSGYISAEAFATLDAKLHSFDIAQWTTDPILSNNVFTNGNKITISPNPVRDVLKIEFGNELLEEFEIILFNAQGQFIQQKNGSSGGVIKWEVSNLPKGIYFLQIISKEKTNTFFQKIIKN